MQVLGKYLILTGLVLVIAGIVIYFFSGHLNWLGKLPGDIKIERENFSLYFPVTTMIIISIILTILVSIIRKLF